MRRLAVLELEVAAQLHPDDARTWELKARAEREAELYEAAADSYRALALLQPANGLVHRARVHALVEAGRLDAAPAAAREWVVAQPSDWEAHLSLAVRLEALGNVEKALAEYRQATALDKGVDTAPLASGALLTRLGRWKDADEAFTSVDTVETLLGWYSQCVCRVKLGDTKGARAWVKKLNKE